MRVLITGHKGYIGSVMSGFLRRNGFDVAGVDCDWYHGCDFGRVREDVPSFETDLRSLEFTDLLSFDAVVHLAALPDDAGGLIAPNLLHPLNFEATLRLAEHCKRAGVQRFLFASTCDVYGRASGFVDETATPLPQTDYARDKLRSEQALAELAAPSFHPLVLRLPTVFGVSPRLRLDTLVNEFVASAMARQRIHAPTIGRAWGPFLHVEDVARAFAALLSAPESTTAGEVINVVDSAQNHRAVDVAEAVTEMVPDSTFAMNPDRPDAGSCRVGGEKLRRMCPRVCFRWTLRDGIRQLRDALQNAGFTPGDWRCSRYRRAAWLCTLLERGDLTRGLGWAADPVSAI